MFLLGLTGFLGFLLFLVRHPLVQDVGPHGILCPLDHGGPLVKKPLVLEDEDAPGLGVHVDAATQVPAEKGRGAALEVGPVVVRGRVVEVKMDRVEGLELAGAVFVPVGAVAVS